MLFDKGNIPPIPARVAPARPRLDSKISSRLLDVFHHVPTDGQKGACRSDEVLNPEDERLRDALKGLQVNEAASEQGSTAGTGPPRQPDEVPPRSHSSDEVNREDLRSSVPDDIKSSVPKSLVHSVQVRVRCLITVWSARHTNRKQTAYLLPPVVSQSLVCTWSLLR